MEKQQQLASNGQAVYQADINVLGESGGLADDRTLAEFIRIKPFDGSNVTKAVFPYGVRGDKTATVCPNGATGSVLVMPFRAFIGSTTGVGTDAKKNWRDIRSGVFAVSTSGTALGLKVTFVANSSGNPRWDLIYATVTPNTAGDVGARKTKDPTTQAVTSPSVTLNLVCAVSVTVSAGTPGASPALPSVPSDGGGSYIVPLAYVRIPNGFTATSTVSSRDILDAEPVALVHRSTGVATLGPAAQVFKPGGVALTAAQIATWGSTGTRPGWFLPPDMMGGDGCLIPLDMFDASQANWNFADGAVVDDSRDWRNRMFKWQLHYSANKFASDPTNGGTVAVPAGYVNSGGSTKNLVSGLGQSFLADSSHTAIPGGPWATVAYIDSTIVGTSNLPSGSGFGLFVDLATGNLILKALGTSPGVRALLWIEASAPMPNY